MVKSIEMKRVEVTLFTFVNPSIDWVPVGVIVRNSRYGSIDKLLKLVRCQRVVFPYYGHQGVDALRRSARWPRSYLFYAHWRCHKLDNKEFAYSIPANDTLSVSFLIRKG
jgi:hypothetical protein